MFNCPTFSGAGQEDFPFKSKYWLFLFRSTKKDISFFSKFDDEVLETFKFCGLLSLHGTGTGTGNSTGTNGS